ncbi:MAG: hypothetical protein ABFC34_13275 [Methanobacterium sp.]
MLEDPSQKDNQQKSLDSLEDPPKKVRKGRCLLDKLLITIVIATLGYIGISFVNCNFLIPGSMERADALGGLKNPPPLDCEESQRRGYDALFVLLTTVLGLKAEID